MLVRPGDERGGWYPDYPTTCFLLSGARIWADYVTGRVSGSSGEVEVAGRVTTGRCNLDFFRGGSKVKVNIGNDDFWVNRLKRSRPPDIVVLDNEQNGKFNFARMRY